MDALRPYIKTIHVLNNRVRQNFDIEIGDRFAPGPTHLILTGPNGSDKSSVLEGVRTYLELYIKRKGNSGEDIIRQRAALRASAILELVYAYKEAFFYCSMPALRKWNLHIPTGIQLVPLGKEGIESSALTNNWFLQYLVNRRMEQALAREDGDNTTANNIAAWFEQFQAALATLFELPHLKLHFHRNEYRFSLELTPGQLSDFDKLPDGFSSILSIWAELLVREQAWHKHNPNQEPTGIVLIDELEAHLHVELQARVLGFFTHLYPKLQFIVTTHSPVILNSIPNAIVYDLGSHESVESHTLQGIRFGTLMTGHLGMDQDFDIQSAHELAELKALVEQNGDPAKIEDLSNRLSSRSRALGSEVWRMVTYPKLVQP